jgi:5-methyltetrahydrofolate--homocysteine methyltransferase
VNNPLAAASNTSVLDRRLAAQGFLLADGATGTNLFDMGLTSGEAPERWLIDHPRRILALHRSFVAAGADIILTNTFGANGRRLKLHGLERRVGELNRIAANLAGEAAAGAGRPVIVAGSVGPTGDLLAPLGDLSEDAAVEVFAEQMHGLKEGGAEIAWIETMSALEEMRAAVRAAVRVGLDFTLTASFDTAGRTMMGIAPSSLAEALAGFSTIPSAIGANCGVGPADLVVSVLSLAAALPQMPIIAKANCGIPSVTGDTVSYSGTPELMADYARLAFDAGARIIGGCCGTSARHLAAMRSALDGYRGRASPEVELVTSLLGPLVSPPRTGALVPRARSRRSRAE